MKRERVVIPCGEIALEGVLHLPDAQGPFPAAVVCHPHPLYGGDMESNVVLTVCDALASLSIAGLRFNFRGAGGSGGSHGGGVKERDDVKTALDYLCTRSEVDKNRLGLVGYSFGGAVVFAVARQDTRIKRLALVSPALDESGWEELKGFPRPKLILLGDADTTVPYTRWKKYFSDDRDFQIVTGADHFWWGFEGEIKKRVGDFFPTSAVKNQTDN